MANEAADRRECLPLVSVVIPCFNGARFLRAAIDSALAQSYGAVEVVVVDDGSTDDSGAIAESYGSRVKVIRQENRGLSAARNRAVAASTGEFVTLLDADDVLLPECVANRARILFENGAVGLVAGYFREIDDDGNVRDRVPELRRIGKLPPFRQAVRRNWGPPVGWTFRREAYERCGGFDPLLRSCEDWDFVIRVARRFAIAYDPTVQVHYRILDGQMSSNFDVMLDAARRVHLKNRACAQRRMQYWFDSMCGQFELGRRILYSVLVGSRGRGRAFGLIARHPRLLWIGALAAVTLVLGKRPSAG